jgi:hypothetical protein
MSNDHDPTDTNPRHPAGWTLHDSRGESDIRLIAQRLQQMERHIEANDKRIDDLAKDRESFFRWGVIALGSIVVAIATWGVSIVMGGHIK